jgi:hypothetical protein
MQLAKEKHLELVLDVGALAAFSGEIRQFPRRGLGPFLDKGQERWRKRKNVEE